jgi:hypothetical protein
MYAEMATFVDRLDILHETTNSVIPWSCPVPFFGEVASVQVATVGINPSNREFTDSQGHELADTEQRLPTLRSLGLSRWSQADARHLREIIDGCRLYFCRNPYDRWFSVLERVMQPSGLTYYGDRPTACHIDLFPFATAEKWGALPGSEQRQLLDVSSDALGSLVRGSHLEVLILNGQSVIDHFELLAGARLERCPIESWSLPRSRGPSVVGVAYSGEVHEIGGVRLIRSLRVLGYNHDLQSSFGVSRQVVTNIGQWLLSCRGVLAS